MKPIPIRPFGAALATLALVSAVGAAAFPADQDDTVPLIVIDGVPLPDAIHNLARQASLNYILDPRVPGSQFGPGKSVRNPIVSRRWTNVSSQEALRSLLMEHKLTLVINPATTVARITPADLGVKPVPASQIGTNTNGVLPLLVMADIPLTEAIRKLAGQAELKVSLDPKLAAPEFDRQGTVAIRWEKLTARQALAALLDNYDLVMVEDPAAASARIRMKTPEEIDTPKKDPGKRL